MLNILTIHLFGDYWGRDIAHKMMELEPRVIGNRIGLVLFVVFGTFVAAVVVQGAKRLVRWSTLEHRLFMLLPLSVFFLYVVALRQFSPKWGNLVKWCYLPQVFPAMALTFCLLCKNWSRRQKLVSVVLMALLIVGSLFQLYAVVGDHNVQKLMVKWFE
jgi:hypothetical protein